MAQKTYPITKMLWLGSAIAVLSGANIAIKGGEGSPMNWLTVACGIGLVILSLVAKKAGRIDA
jgi:hypothetical protein